MSRSDESITVLEKTAIVAIAVTAGLGIPYLFFSALKDRDSSEEKYKPVTYYPRGT